jgi:microcystin-dependent protein
MDGFLGEIQIFTGKFAPQDWAYCDGQEITVKSAAAGNLYKVLGNQFGGNPHFEIPTFALPKLPDPFPNARYIICIVGLTLPSNDD